MVTGWLQIGDSWYYLQPSGAMATGWVWIGGTWYFFSDLGQWS
jgi:putative cell wall binding protein